LKTNRKLELKVVPIGNSRGVRLPRQILAKYLIRDSVILEERAEGILLKSNHDTRLSWEDTFREMGKEREDWADFDATTADGLDKDPW
jgi:antitoxin MazE